MSKQKATLRPGPAMAENGRYYRDICWMATPVLCMAVYLYGPRPALMCLVALLVGNLCDRLVALLRRRPYVANDFSNESFAVVIALLLPASASWYVLVAAVLVGVLVGKEAFGGYGNYPFHPAAVGYVIAAVSWPQEVFRYPATHTVLPLGSTAGVTLGSGLGETLKNGGLPLTDKFDLILGDYAGPMGTTAALIILACILFLLVRGDINWETPLTFLAMCMLVSLVAPRQADLVGTSLLATLPARLNAMGYEILSGAMLFSVAFILCEPYTCPRTRAGRLLYGAVLGFVAMMFRYYGVYETGVCFAVLAVNSVSGGFDRLTHQLYGRRAQRTEKAAQPPQKGGDEGAC